MGQPPGSPIGVMPPCCMPVSSSARAWSAKEILRTPKCLRTTRLTSARSVASTMTAARVVTSPPTPLDDDAVRRGGGVDVIRGAERRRVRQRRVDPRRPATSGHSRVLRPRAVRRARGARQPASRTGFPPQLAWRHRTGGPQRQRTRPSLPSSTEWSAVCQPSPARSAHHHGRGHVGCVLPTRTGPERHETGVVCGGRGSAEGARQLVDLGIRGGRLAVALTHEIGLEGPGQAAREGTGHGGPGVGRILEGAAVGECRAGLGGEEQGRADLDGGRARVAELPRSSPAWRCHLPR